ncbi:unnamed protein product [Symbiodinium natans]|uniref:Uncharacterized protein n=1 Tax=Symbiodinium natans TaxID=878477 RepID=A0A812G1B5_9DINO|nr:unnamed protein product [Symbiodinium natans]
MAYKAARRSVTMPTPKASEQRRPSRPMPRLSPALARPMQSLHLPAESRRHKPRPRKNSGSALTRSPSEGDYSSAQNDAESDRSGDSDDELTQLAPVVELFDASFSWQGEAPPEAEASDKPPPVLRLSSAQESRRTPGPPEGWCNC